VADTSRMVVDIKVSGRTRALLSAGQRAEVVVDAKPGRVFRARVEKVGNFGRDAFEHLDARTRDLVGKARRRVFNVRVVLDPVEEVLKPGLMARVTIIVDDATGVLLVPREALRAREDTEAEVRVRVDGRAETRAIRVGRDNGDMVEVVSGLSEGDLVILGGD
jgi:multidrug efflux pump subunit AcrA (membrane-fusion protein)